LIEIKIYIKPKPFDPFINCFKDGFTIDSCQDNSNKPKINWDNEIIPSGIWYDKSLFSIGNLNITLGGLLLSVGGIVGIIIAILVVICGISWWKRKKLAEMASKITSASVRKSVWIRKSLKRMSTKFDWGNKNRDTPDEEKGEEIQADPY
jgi:hypothetical protein